MLFKAGFLEFRVFCSTQEKLEIEKDDFSVSRLFSSCLKVFEKLRGGGRGEEG